MMKLKLPRRQFLHLAAGAAALPAVSRFAWAQTGLTKDDREAVRLFKLAVDQGNADAQDNLGLMYAQGRGGLSKDEAEAARLFKLAADQGNPGAQTNLGFMYAQGRGGL